MIILFFISMLFKDYMSFVFFDTVSTPNSKRKSLYMIAYLIAITCLYTFLIPNLALPQYSLILISIIDIAITWLFYSETLFKILLFSIANLIIGMVSELLSGIILIGFNVSVSSFNNDIFYSTVITAFSAFLILLICITIQLFKKQSIRIPPTVLLVLFFGSSMLILFVLYWLLTEQLTGNEMALYALVIFLIVLSNALLVLFTRNTMSLKLDQQRLKYVESYIETNKQHNSDLIRQQTETRRIRHDLKSGLLHISGLLQNEQYEDCAQVVDQLMGVTRNLESIVDTGHSGLDAIISDKIKSAQAQGITIDHSINLIASNELLIDELDLSLICGNLLDNAIEATIPCDPPKSIDFQINYDSTLRVIHIVCQNPTVLEDLNTKTTKADKLNHGFGIENVRLLADKWQGNTNIQLKDHCYSIIVTLVNQAL